MKKIIVDKEGIKTFFRNNGGAIAKKTGLVLLVLFIVTVICMSIYCVAAYADLRITVDLSDEQQTFQGGSGAGCVNVTFNADILRRMERGELKRVLVLATGALLNKDTPLQKETIPGISHAFVVEAEEIAEEE